MNIIFLDFDGVINSDEFYMDSSLFEHGFDLQRSLEIFAHSPKLLIDPKLLGHVKDLCSSLDASIVISSSWRIYCEKDDFIRMFDFHGWSNAPIIDLTKALRSEGKCRGDEVQLWLDTHSVDDYIIIDDVDNFHLDQNFFKTDFNYGFTKECLQQVVNMMPSAYAISPTPN